MTLTDTSMSLGDSGEVTHMAVRMALPADMMTPSAAVRFGLAGLRLPPDSSYWTLAGVG